MGGVNKEQIEQARTIDLLSYLQANEPHELKRSGLNEFRTVTHSSLVISNGKWIWNKTGVGGVSALDYLIKVRGMRFVDAVETVCDSRAAVVSALPVNTANAPKKFAFYPPKPSRYATKAVRYLQQRGISAEVINRCIQMGILFESRYYNPQSEHHNAVVCVFAGPNESGRVVFAAMRGVSADFKKDKAGSDKRYNFCLPAKNPNRRHLAVFESPIDALSHATLQQRDGWDCDVHRLSLGGTSNVALISFLERNPQIKRVILHLDNDEAGIIAARKIKMQFNADSRFAHIRVSVNPPRRGKDYNEVLQNVISLEREQKPLLNRRRNAADIFI